MSFDMRMKMFYVVVDCEHLVGFLELKRTQAVESSIVGRINHRHNKVVVIFSSMIQRLQLEKIEKNSSTWWTC
ncbi:hypothetical protein LINPERHAP2_LOCUS33266 [Linum perenne]